MAPCPCRICRAPLPAAFLDLGLSPLCQTVIAQEDEDKPEEFFPLRLHLCPRCMLVQVPPFVDPKRLFTEYAYFSSFSETFLRHNQAFAEAAVRRFGLTSESRVVEAASNDGYLLQFFAKQGIPVLGVEPAANVARTAVEKGIPTAVRFFGEDTARLLLKDGMAADLFAANNVLPHVPDLHDFVGGIKILLKPAGTACLEFQHLLTMMEGNQFDTVYQEHYSYLTLAVVRKLFFDHGLSVFDVDRTGNHGGSLRIYARHAEAAPAPTPAVAGVLEDEERVGMGRPEYYEGFGERVRECKRGLLEFLIRARREGKRVAGYGAAGKTNTLLNFCGIREDFLDYTVDRNPYKQGKRLPGTRIPVLAPEKLRETRPDYLFVGIWNMLPEVMEQTAYIREWGGKWVVPIPSVRILD